jgi:hypothetical protein
MSTQRPSYLWDYAIDEGQFRQLLDGSLKLGRLDQRWAAVRLLEHAAYAEVIRLLGYRRLVDGWPGWRDSIRSKSRQRGFDFLVEWLPEHRPDLLAPPA